MKFIQYIILFLLAGTIFSSCVKEPAELNLNIEVEKTDVEAGESVVYTISGKADFISFYSGLPGASFEDYPAANAISVATVRSDPFEYIYNNLHETVTATFIASSHGNWGNDVKVSQFDFNITVTDNRNGLASFTIKTGGLFGKSFTGVINEIPKNMHRSLFTLRTQLNARNGFNRRRCRCSQQFRNTTDAIMVGQCQCRYAAFIGHGHQFCWCVAAI